MRLKRLKLSGFKSFCDDTSLDFKQNGITLVVGPNGCGKSNVVDAIRWVLGEQSPSFLRGSAMGDVIFNGSEERKPVGRSEVTILFDNEEGLSPEKYRDYTEISVTRRLYRSGESEYLINKMPCRLMDVRELVMDTGVAGRSYSIVEQGRVEEFITASPAERRIYMEEAAGIVRYKTKRIAAERKLEQTRQNLLRVADLQGELRRQESQLRSQKEKAQQYLELRDKVNAMDARLASAKYQASARRCAAMTASRDAAAQQTTLQAQGLSTVQTRLDQLTLEQTQRETQLNDGREAMRGSENEIQEVRAGLGLEKQQRENRQEWIGRTQTELAEFQRRGEALTGELDGGESELATLTQQDEDRRGEIVGLEAEHGEKEAGRAAVEADIQSLREELTECHTNLSGIASQQQFLAQRLAEGGQRRTGLETQTAAIGQEQEGVRESLAGMEQATANLRDAMEQGEERALVLGREIAAKALQFEENQAIQAEMEREIVTCRSRMTSLQEIEAGREGFDEAVRAVLEWAETIGNLREEVSWMGPLADFIRVKPEVAEWAGDFLEPSLGYIVLRNADKLPVLQERLEAAGMGGVKTVALDAYAHTAAAGPAQAEGESLADHVELPPEFDALRKGLYGGVRLHPAGPLPHPLPQGDSPCTEWLAADGRFHIDHRTVVAMGAGEVTNGGILRRRGEILALEQSLAELERRQQAVKARVGELEAEAGALQARLQEGESLRHQHNLELSQLEQEQGHVEREAARLAQVMENLAGSRRQLEEEAEGFRRQQTGLEADTQRRQEEQARLEADLAAAQEKSNVAALGVAAVGQRLTESKVAHQGVLTRLEHAAGRLKELKAEQASLAEKQAQAEQNLAQQQTALAETEQNIFDVTASLGEMEAALAGQRKAVLEAAGNFDREESARKELAHEAAEERRKLEHMQTKLHEVELELTAERTRMEQWAEKMGLAPGDAPQAGTTPAEYSEDAEDDEALEQELAAARLRLEKIEGVNLAAPEEYEALAARLDFLLGEKEDLETAIADLETSIRHMNQESRRRFKDTFDAVNEKFQEIFPVIFNGGAARLVLTDSEDLLLAGVDIVAQPPGKNLQNLSLLSGGEKALTAIALIFSFFLYKPSPFCLLDEVDAPLDDINVGRFTRMIQSMTERSQFIIITHNKRTMEIGDLLYGVTMEEAGVSKIVSVNLAG